MKAFEWEKDTISGYKCVRLYIDNKHYAAKVRSYRDGYKLFYETEIFINEYKVSRKHKTLEDAKKYCDKTLEDAGIKTIEEHYRVLI
jgi:hypothetical protein